MSDSMQRLLDAIADGEFHSGEELGDLLGVSRTAVWKQIQKLDDLGLGVETLKGKGYRVEGGIELLSDSAIRAGLTSASAAQLADLNILQTVDSTNSAARLRVENGDATGLVIMAEQQSAGRGRRGRPWVSPFARNLYLSTVWGFEGAAALEGLSLAVGVAVKRALVHCQLPDAELKWPNDVLFGGRKLAGILLEMIGDPSGFCQVVVGIGINIHMPAGQGADIDQQWTDLYSAAGGPISRNQVATLLLNELLPLLADYQQRGFAAYRDEWQCSDAFRNKAVRLVTANREISGIASGVSESGAIGLKIDGELHYYNGGEISLRGAGL